LHIFDDLAEVILHMYDRLIDTYFEEKEKELVEDILKWVSVKSDKGEAESGFPYGKEPALALEIALNRAKEFGFSVKNYENYVGTVSFSDKPVELDILAHLDVVPARDEDWTVTKPFSPIVKDGRIYGRGTADDKGPAVCALYAMKAVKDLGIPLSKNVRLILGTDEECGSSDIAYFYQKEKEAPMTFSPDADFPLVNTEKGRLHSGFTASFEKEAVSSGILEIYAGTAANVIPDEAVSVVSGIELTVCDSVAKIFSEKTGVIFRVSSEEKGIRIEAKGKAGHAAMPDEGANNALTALLELLAGLPLADGDSFRKICAISSMFPHGDYWGEAAGVKMKDEISGPLTISLNIFQYDGMSLSCEFDSRCPVMATDENMRLVLLEKGKIEGLTMLDKKMRPAHHVPEDSFFVQTLLEIYEKYSGEKGECLSIGGGTYVHDLKNGVAFGCAWPGTNYKLHGADEFCVISEMITSAKMFVEAILRICG